MVEWAQGTQNCLGGVSIHGQKMGNNGLIPMEPIFATRVCTKGPDIAGSLGHKIEVAECESEHIGAGAIASQRLARCVYYSLQERTYPNREQNAESRSCKLRVLMFTYVIISFKSQGTQNRSLFY
jgi:hypothetical protein